MSFADSIRQTASIARWVSGGVMTTDQTIFDRPVQGGQLRQRPKRCPARVSRPLR
jgi:hypothetical protein